MIKIPLTKGKEAIIDNESLRLVGNFKWMFARYPSRRGGKLSDKTIHMHQILMWCPNKYEVDHINGDKLDNRLCNLRIATHQQNIFNKPPTKQNKSGYKGVSWDKRRGKWVTSVFISGKEVYKKRFLSKKEAAKAYDKKAKELFGEFAYLNF